MFFGEPHDFDPGADADTFQGITIPPGTEVYLVLQWDSPFYSVSPPGSQNDIDIFLTNDPPTTVLAYGIDNNVATRWRPCIIIIPLVQETQILI